MKAAAARLRADLQTGDPEAAHDTEDARGDRAPPPAPVRIGGNAPASDVKAQAARRPFVVRAGVRLRRALDPFLSRHSKVGDEPFLDNSHFPWIRELEANWDIVRDEALEMMRYREAIPPLNEISPDHTNLAGVGKWRSFFLWGYGARVPANCARCPRTAELMRRVPGMRTALFSIHEPGMRIPLHNGVTKAICVLHLGLRTPADKAACRIEVDGESRAWRDGEAFVFDDTRPHETWNDTPEDRIILLVQFDRPMRFPASWVGRAFLTAIRYSPFIRDAQRNMGDWEHALQTMERAGSDRL